MKMFLKILSMIICILAIIFVVHCFTHKDSTKTYEIYIGRVVREETVEAVETVETNVESVLISEPEPISNSIPIESYKDAARYVAKAVWGEARGCTVTEQAAVIWCILNRVDANYDSEYSPKAVIEIVTEEYQFTGYRESNPVTNKHYNLAIDVIERWLREKNGETDVGRVLPNNYLYFAGDGERNHFRDQYRNGTYWDWSLESPYED